MAEQAAKEPTMEEILSSIRRIISEGGEPGDEAVGATEIASVPETESSDSVAEEAFDVSELLGHNETPAAENENDHLLSVDELLSNDDLDYSDAADESVAEISSEEGDLSDTELDDAFMDSSGDLDDLLNEIDAMDSGIPEDTPIYDEPDVTPEPQMETAMAEPQLQQSAPPAANFGTAAVGGNTIEGMVSGLMQPIIKEWIDANLPTIVERRVEAEINQIAAKVIAALRDQ